MAARTIVEGVGELTVCGVELEDLGFTVMLEHGWTEWDERHPMWGSRNCPEPYVTKQGYRLLGVYLVTEMAGVYKKVMDLTDQISDNDWVELEKEVV